jgi:uncharacterized protein
MNTMIISDLHGSYSAFQKIEDCMQKLSVDKLIILGDVLYHGPRNILPEGYDPKKLAERLNGYADMITAVRGNCDAEVDQAVLNFPIMAEDVQATIDGTDFFLTHGHRPQRTESYLPEVEPGTVFASGHTHVKRIAPVATSSGTPIVLVNPGSPSLPKDGVASFAFFADGLLTLRDLNGDTLSQMFV